MESYLLPHSEGFSVRINILMVLYVLQTQPTRSKIAQPTASFFAETLDSIPKARHQIQMGSSTRVSTYNGHTTRILSIVQKPTGSRKELFDELKKEQRQRRLKEAYPINGVTAGWNVIATWACDKTWCKIRWTLDPVRSRSPLPAHLLER